MDTYHKIQTIYKRNHDTHRIMPGEWTKPEFEFLQNNIWTFTEKVDGTNIRVGYDGETIKFGGRTENAQLPMPLVERLHELFTDDVMSHFSGSHPNVTLYGEGYGAKIQKGGGNYCSHQDFVLFDVKIDGWWLQRENVEDIAESLGIDVVPVIGYGTLHDAVRLAANSITSTWGDFEAEGIVARPKTELCMRDGSRIIAKIKCRDFRE